MNFLETTGALNTAFNLKIIPVSEDGNFLTSASLSPEAIASNISSLTDGKPIILQYNPQSFSVKEDADYASQQAQGKEGDVPQYKGIKPKEFSVEFTIDSTGVTSPLKIPVNVHVALFRALTTEPKSSTHKPDRLIVQYGTFISDCHLMSSEITYNLFDRQGFPLRAKVKASFKEITDSKLNALARKFASPDVTHGYIVTDINELLSYITYQFYKNDAYYTQVAKANDMNTFRGLEQGTKIFLPPIQTR